MSLLDTTVRGASSQPVIAAGAGMGAGAVSYPFLDPACPLFPSSNEYIERILSAGVSSQDRLVLAQYLAIAESWHVLEGWRYLSQAGAALLNGARRASLHLAYYAELRAARSILAGSGVAILDQRHFGLDSSGNILLFGGIKSRVATASEPTLDALLSEFVVQLWRRALRRKAPLTVAAQRPIGTHVAAGKALKAWASTSGNGIRVVDALRGLRFRGIDWVEACRFTAMREAVAGAWLADWSMDLRSLTRDSEARNQASYGVALDRSELDSVREAEIRLLGEMNEAWMGLDSGEVDSVDLALVHDFVLKSARVLGRRTPRSGSHDVWARLESYLTGSGGLTSTAAKDALDAVRGTPAQAGNAILTAAARNNVGVSGVLARAFLLLRLSTALLIAQWKQMALRSPGGVLPWQETLLRDFAVHTHLSGSGSAPDFRDLEEDQAEALSELEGWLSNAPFDPFETWQGKADLLRNLCCFERAFLVAAAS